jgi:hypothetical protein
VVDFLAGAEQAVAEVEQVLAPEKVLAAAALMMARTVRLNPAVIASGGVAVGATFGVSGG